MAVDGGRWPPAWTIGRAGYGPGSRANSTRAGKSSNMEPPQAPLTPPLPQAASCAYGMITVKIMNLQKLLSHYRKQGDQFILKFRKPSKEDGRRPGILSRADGLPARQDEEQRLEVSMRVIRRGRLIERPESRKITSIKHSAIFRIFLVLSLGSPAFTHAQTPTQDLRSAGLMDS